jgi:hypothetical protein
VWTAWAGPGGTGQDPVVVPNRQGLLDLLVIGSDGAVWTRTETAAGQWAPWTSLGGLARSLAAGLDSLGLPEVFAQGPNGTLWWKDQNAGGLWV